MRLKDLFSPFARKHPFTPVTFYTSLIQIPAYNNGIFFLLSVFNVIIYASDGNGVRTLVSVHQVLKLTEELSAAADL